MGLKSLFICKSTKKNWIVGMRPLKKSDYVTFITVYMDNPAYFCIVIEIV